jgi:WD40 repeat protein
VKTQRFIDNITSITPGALKGGLSALDRHPTKDEYLCGGSDGQPKLFKMLRTQARQIGDNANLLKDYQPMPGRVWSLAFAKDGNQFAAASSNDGAGEVRIYVTADGKITSKLEVPESGIYAVAFSPDGSTVAAGGFDGDVRLIKVADGTLIKKFTPVEVAAKVAGK